MNLWRRVWIAMAISFVATFGTAQGERGFFCERCRRPCTQMRVTVIDWRTNERHQYGCLPCAVLDMAEKFPWSRATIQAKTSPRAIYLTRGGKIWTAQPETAVALVPPLDAPNPHRGYFVFPRRVEAERFLIKKAEEVIPGSKIVPLLQVPLLVRGHRFPPPLRGEEIVAGIALKDIPPDHWAAEAVHRVVKEGLMEGIPGKEFKGDRPLTRYELAVILDRLLRRWQRQRVTAKEVVKGLVQELRRNGAPPEEVQAALRLVRQGNTVIEEGADLQGAHGAREMPLDVPKNHWATEAVKRVIKMGLLKGYPDGTFRGDRPITRYEIALVLSRLLDWLEKRRKEHPPLQPTPKETPMGAKEPQKPVLKPTPQGQRLPSPQRLEAKIQELERELVSAGLTIEEVRTVLAPLRERLKRRRPKDRLTPEREGRIQALLEELERELTESGMTQRETQSLLSPVRERLRLPLTPKPRPKKERQRPIRPAPQASLLGPTGLLLTPTAHLLSSRMATAGFARTLDSNITHVNIGFFHPRLELTGTLTAGHLPTRLLFSAKYQLWEAPNKRTRLALGILDAFDEIDTSFYGVLTRDVPGRLGKRPVRLSVSIGLSGGDLIEGLFGGLILRWGRRLSFLTEVVSFGQESQVNFGLRYRLRQNIAFQLGIVDSKISGGIALRQGF